MHLAAGLIIQSRMRTFTLDEAQWLLPVLQGLFKQAIEGKALMEEIDAEFLLVTHRILLLGGMLPDVHYLAGRRVLREKAGGGGL